MVKYLGMPEASFNTLLQKLICSTKFGGYNDTSSTKIEKYFCEYFKSLNGMFFGISTNELRILAYEF